MTAVCICSRPRTGLVTSRPLGGIEDSYAAAPVCSDTECIAEAKAWVTRVSFGKPAHYVPDPKTDDEAATPRADMGVRSTPAAVSATAVGAAGPASSSSATGGRVTSEVATLPPVPQRKRGETDEEGLELGSLTEVTLAGGQGLLGSTHAEGGWTE